MIQAPTDIMPGDIPMNGTPCFFPMQDGSAIYMKAWSADGTINYLNAQKMQDLRDENFQYKLAASQAEQNNYLVNQLRPCPIPAYPSCNPWAATNCGTTGCCGA